MPEAALTPPLKSRHIFIENIFSLTHSKVKKQTLGSAVRHGKLFAVFYLSGDRYKVRTITRVISVVMNSDILACCQSR